MIIEIRIQIAKKQVNEKGNVPLCSIVPAFSNLENTGFLNRVSDSLQSKQQMVEIRYSTLGIVV